MKINTTSVLLWQMLFNTKRIQLFVTKKKRAMSKVRLFVLTAETFQQGSHLIMHRTNGLYWTPNPGPLAR